MVNKKKIACASHCQIENSFVSLRTKIIQDSVNLLDHNNVLNVHLMVDYVSSSHTEH